MSWTLDSFSPAEYAVDHEVRLRCSVLNEERAVVISVSLPESMTTSLARSLVSAIIDGLNSQETSNG